MRHLRLAAVCCLVLVPTARAEAQNGPFVVGAVGLDIARYDHAEFDRVFDVGIDAVVPAGSLQVGIPLGNRWGVELGFGWSGRTDSEQGFPADSIANLAPLSLNSRGRRRNSSVDTALWFRQSLGPTVDLVSFGGIAFTRKVQDAANTRPGSMAITEPSRLVDYGVAPLVGVEMRIGLPYTLNLVPGVRIQGLADGWLLRPSIGLGWFF